MYELIKVTDRTYTIIIRNQEVGKVEYNDGKWTSKCGDLVITQKSRKKAVESILYTLIMRSLNLMRV